MTLTSSLLIVQNTLVKIIVLLASILQTYESFTRVPLLGKDLCFFFLSGYALLFAATVLFLIVYAAALSFDEAAHK